MSANALACRREEGGIAKARCAVISPASKPVRGERQPGSPDDGPDQAGRADRGGQHQIASSAAPGKARDVLPDDVEVSYQFDQSPYVTRAIQGLFVEGALGAVLTGLMVLLFLRDWRSSLVVVLNIPLAILASVTALWVSGQTINIMTLGGLALAVGILVDEATVTIENIHTRLADGRSLARAASEATAETTLPRFVAMLCILAVFIPAFFMTGAAHNLFVPLALAVGFSMVGSYLLSSTFVPVLSIWLLSNPSTHQTPQETFFDRLRARYDWFLRVIMRRRRIVVLSYLIVSGAIIFVVGSSLGTEIFPSVDTGQLQLHLRAPAGTRIERTEQIALQTLDVIKREVGPDNVEISLGFVGTQPPNYPINTIYLWSSGSEEAVLQVRRRRRSEEQDRFAGSVAFEDLAFEFDAPIRPCNRDSLQ